MINNKTILAIIPARGGSKGVLRKNIREVGGKPLIAWTIGEAKKSKYIDRLILSSENGEIIRVAKEWGCEVPFIRPDELAQDDTPGVEPVLHAMETLKEKYDYAVLLQPTSPLRTVEDIDACIELCVSRKAKSCVSVTEPDKSPYWMFSLDNDGRLSPLLKTESQVLCRQYLPKVYALNGAVYVAECKSLSETRSLVSSDTLAYKMGREFSLDIDTEQDLMLFDLLSTLLKKA